MRRALVSLLCVWIVVIEECRGQRLMCPAGWVTFENSFSTVCLYPSQNSLSAQAAGAFCRENVAYLIDVESINQYSVFINRLETEFTIAEYMVENFNLSEFWTSMRVRDGRLVTEEFGRRYIRPHFFDRIWNWDFGQPTLDNGICGQMRLQTRTEVIVDNPETQETRNVTRFAGSIFASLQDCAKEQRFICQKPAVSPELKITFFCPDGWIGNVHVPYCFRVFTEAKSFSEARASCGQYPGGLLAPSGTEYDDRFIVIVYDFYQTNSKFFESGINGVWVGGGQSEGGTCPTIEAATVEAFQFQNCSLSVPFMCIRNTVFNQPSSFDISSPYSSQQELMTYRPFQFNLPISCEMSRQPRQTEFTFIRTPTVIINMTDQSRFQYDFQYPQTISPPTETPYVFGISIPPLNSPLRKRSTDTETTNRVKRQFDGSGSGILPPFGEIGVDFNLLIEYTGLYSGALVSINPPVFIETDPVLVRFAEADLYIYVARVGILDSAIIQNEISTQELLSFNLFRNEGYLGVLGEYTARFSSLPSENFPVVYYDARVEQIYNKTVQFRIFFVPPLGRDTPTETEQFVLVALQQYWETEAGSSPVFFANDTVQIRSTVKCSTRTVTDPGTGKDVTFRAARPGQTTFSSERCQNGSGALAQAQCLGGYWIGVYWGPVTFRDDCSTVDLPTLPQSSSTNNLKNLSEIFVNPVNFQDILTDTQNLTLPDVDLTELDVIYTAVILQNYQELDTVIPESLEVVIDIVNNILETDEGVVETAQDIRASANTIIQALDDLSYGLDIGQDDLRLVRPLVATVVTDQDGTEDTFIIGLKLEGVGELLLTNDSVKAVESPDDVIAAAIIQNVDAAIFLPSDLLNGSKSRLSMQIYAETRLFFTPNGRYSLNSRVVAARLTVSDVPVTDLGEFRVTAVFLPKEKSDNTVCGYWNYSANDNAGDWATDGCYKSTSGDHVICTCDHLTNFAILVDLQAHTISETNKKILGIITAVGLIVSIVGLGLTLLTFVIFKHLRSGRGQQVLVNLSLAMLCSAIIFLVGAERTENKTGCKVIAALLHYFILVSFMWMLVEGILQYLRFVKVLGTYIPKFILKAAIPAWGLPIIPVIIILAIDTNLYYGGYGYCWLGFNAMLYAFLIPVGVIILANLIVFLMVLWKLCCGRKGLQVNQSERKMRFLHFQAALSVFVILGLTWVFGFMAIDWAQVVFHYLFAILNAFQGFFIFLLFTAREKKIRQAWMKLCCKKKYREKSSSSATANDGYARKGDNSVSNTVSNSTAYTSSGGSNSGFHDISSSDDTNDRNGSRPMNFRNPEFDN